MAHADSAMLEEEALGRFSAGPLMLRASWTMVAIGVLAFIAGIFIDKERAWANWLMGSFYFTSIVLGGFFLLAVSHLTSAAWFITTKRVFESLAGWLPVGLATTLILLGGAGVLYEWTHHHSDGSTHAALLEHKAPWLNLPFFGIRVLFYFGIWILLTRLLQKHSRMQDADGDLIHSEKSRKYSAIYVVAMAPTLSLAAFDWLMSLDATWFSTMFGVYHFTGGWQSSIAVVIVLTTILRRLGWMKCSVSDDHRHSLGQWFFATTVFWGYIWFFQWMLIWYANIPEETQYFLKRSEGAWWHVSYVVNPLFNFLLPFVLLLPRKAKRSEAMLLRVAIVVLLGHWIDLWVGVMPLFGGVAIGPLEIGIFIGFVGGFGLVVFKELGKASLVPVKDPYLEESLNQHT